MLSSINGWKFDMVWKSDMPDGMGHEADLGLFAISTLLMGIMATNA